jgi:nitrite reductase (NO-forming)
MREKRKNMQAGVLALVVGMAALLVIAAAALGRTGFGGSADVSADKVWDMPDAVVSANAYHGAPAVGEYLSLAPNLARLPAGNRTHDVRLDVVAQEVEVAPDVRYMAWTFGGTLPGPVLHVRGGDRIRFSMANRSDEEVQVSVPIRGGADLANAPISGGNDAVETALSAVQQQKPVAKIAQMPHSMDFHAGTVAADDKWKTIVPGQAIDFEWVANYPGVYIYHCGVAPVLMHMGMGQYGVVVVSPRDGYPTDQEVDREYVVVQSEFYLKPVPGDSGLYQFDLDAALAGNPTVVAFNGYKTSMVDHPLVAKPGERVRLYLLNVGPNDTWSAHVIGAIFDHVWYEGTPHNDMQAMQTVLLGASNGAVAEFVVPEAGEYVLVDHEMKDAYRGAVGKIVASADAPAPAPRR